MSELGWSAPVRRIDAPSALRGIRWQHGRIRALLERARIIAEQTLEGAAP